MGVEPDKDAVVESANEERSRRPLPLLIPFALVLIGMSSLIVRNSTRPRRGLTSRCVDIDASKAASPRGLTPIIPKK